ncbi:hypothetical protein H0O00_05170 [Candidatus Micrarchaeota archaeon]|nr:hypothetical protein [Candidatus Micrarchaeota archaeon]
MKIGYALAILFAFIILAGCCITPPPGTGGTGTTGQGTGDGYVEYGTGGDTGGDVIVVDNSGSHGMSDPSKCNNLPPQQMADCLEQAMGN